MGATRLCMLGRLSKVRIASRPDALMRYCVLTYQDYEQICLRDPDWQPQYAATGNGIAIMANRLSYFFNFHGPSMTVDTGCSGSLVSVHLAAQSLRNGESSVVIRYSVWYFPFPDTL